MSYLDLELLSTCSSSVLVLLLLLASSGHGRSLSGVAVFLWIGHLGLGFGGGSHTYLGVLPFSFIGTTLHTRGTPLVSSRLQSSLSFIKVKNNGLTQPV